MKKQFIKLNDNYHHLSLGNIINCIKALSKNSTSAIQSEVFCVIFNTDDVINSTVNNYCIGARRISDQYRQIYVSLKNKMELEETSFMNIMNKLLTLIFGSIKVYHTVEEINAIEEMRQICSKLYNISKNDFFINKSKLVEFQKLMKDKNFYKCFFEMLSFAILDKKQPLYESEKTRNVIESILENTEISALDLQNFLLMELNEGSNFSHSIINLAKAGNPYANYKLAMMEYEGSYAKTPRFDHAYEYFKKAADHNHPSAHWMIGDMLLKGKIGSNSKEDDQHAVVYFKKAEELGNIASLNSLGRCFLNGLGLDKDEQKAFRYFKKAAKLNYAYAYNNLGLYYESTGEQEKALTYFLASADLHECYACNKVGEIYRKSNQLALAFSFYQKALNGPKQAICKWAYYNLAKYYYLNGNFELNIIKNTELAKTYFAESEALIESLIELLLLAIEENNDSAIMTYKRKIETNSNYNNRIRNRIQKIIKKQKKSLIL